MLCLDQQNAQLERDIGRYKVIREMTGDQLGWERLDARARVVIEGPKADELQHRGGAPNQFLQELVADFHAAKARRSDAQPQRELTAKRRCLLQGAACWVMIALCWIENVSEK